MPQHAIITSQTPHFFSTRESINQKFLIDSANEAIRFTTTHCPYGPANLDNAILARRKYYALRNHETTYPYTQHESAGLPAVIAFLLLYQDPNDFELKQRQQPHFQKIINQSQLSLLYGTGTCTEFSNIAFCYLALQPNMPPLQIATISGERESHTVVAIGNMRGDTRNILICDPWLKLVFPLSKWNEYCLDQHKLTNESELQIQYCCDRLNSQKKTAVHQILQHNTEPLVIAPYRRRIDDEVKNELKKWQRTPTVAPSI